MVDNADNIADISLVGKVGVDVCDLGLAVSIIKKMVNEQ